MTEREFQRTVIATARHLGWRVAHFGAATVRSGRVLTPVLADGAGFHIPRGYIYFAMAFSAAVEVVNVLALRARRRAKPAKSGRQD